MGILVMFTPRTSAISVIKHRAGTFIQVWASTNGIARWNLKNQADLGFAFDANSTGQ